MSEILVIDTSTDSVSIACGTSTMDSVSENRVQRAFHSENIITCIDSVLSKRKISPNEISAVGVEIGPGLFTGLRVGISCAHAFAQAREIPLVYFSSLELTAISSTFDLANQRGNCAVARDARRNELYFAVYKLSRVAPYLAQIDETQFSSCLERVENEKLISPEDFVDRCNSGEDLSIVLDDIKKYQKFELLSDQVKAKIIPARIDTSLVIDHVIDSVMSSNTADVLNPQALYIRKSDAELSWGTA